VAANQRASADLGGDAAISSAFQISRDFGELGEGGFEVFGDL